jgi:hypothetical protein
MAGQPTLWYAVDHPGAIFHMSTAQQNQPTQQSFELLKNKLNEFFETQDSSTTIDDLNTCILALRSKDDVKLTEKTLQDIQFRFAQIMKLIPSLQLLHTNILINDMKGGRPHVS